MAGKRKQSSKDKKARSRGYVIEPVQGRILPRRVMQTIFVVIAVLVIFIMLVTLVPGPGTQ